MLRLLVQGQTCADIGVALCKDNLQKTFEYKRAREYRRHVGHQCELLQYLYWLMSLTCCNLAVQDAVVRPASIRKQPYVVTRSVNGVAIMRVRIQLHLTDAIDDAYRMQSFTHVMTTSAAPSQGITIQHTHAFPTQTVMYSPGTSTYPSSNISGCLEHNIHPAAKRRKS